jgi:type II secretory pathway pseudopilin PulG
MAEKQVTRLVPDEPLPAYAFVPGRFPHPISDPAGHSFGKEPAVPPQVDPERWQIFSFCKILTIGNHRNCNPCSSQIRIRFRPNWGPNHALPLAVNRVMTSLRTSSRSAITMVELLLVLGVIMILGGLVLPLLARSREQAHLTSCRNNLRQLALAVHQYHHQNRAMPPYASGQNGEVFGSWFIHLMPYVEQESLYNKILVQQKATKGSIKMLGTTSSASGVGHATFPVLLCDSDPSRAGVSDANKTNYLANWYAWGNGQGGAYTPRQTFVHLTDGLSQVVLFGEGYSLCKKTPRLATVSNFYHNFGLTPQGKPSDDPAYLPADFTMFQAHPRPKDCDPWRTQTPHDVMNVSLADGSVRSLPPTLPVNIWKQALNPRDGAFLNMDW